MRTAPRGTVLAALLRSATALLVADGSSCSVQCGNVLDSTSASDVTCDESSYSSGAGIVFEKCIRCEASSTYTAGNATDLQSMLYNLRFTTSYCLFGDPNNTDVSGTPCVTDRACGRLRPSIEFDNLTTRTGAYDYCDGWDGERVEPCRECLTAGSHPFLANFVGLMDTACSQKPAPSHTLAFKGDPFSTDHVNATTPTPESLGSWNPDNSVLNLGARVGIAVGGIVFLLTIVGCGIVWNGKRRRRAFLRDLERRNAQTGGGWNKPGAGNGGNGGNGNGNGGGVPMFGSPVSQRPLRGWGDSPVSAAATETTDRTLVRHLSPYSSTYNSPVSAVEGPMAVNWPTLSPQRLGALSDAEVAAAIAAAGGHGYLQARHQHGLASSSSPSSAFANWPTSNQEKLMQMQMQLQQGHEHELEHDYRPPADIGVAFGGDEASLRSKDSNPQMNGGTPNDYTQNNNNNNNRINTYNKTIPSDYANSVGKGKSPASEAYEMDEVGGGGWQADPNTVRLQSNNPYRMPAEPQAPLLHHPGYGRGLPGRPPAGSVRYAGLTEEDARRGHAV